MTLRFRRSSAVTAVCIATASMLAFSSIEPVAWAAQSVDVTQSPSATPAGSPAGSVAPGAVTQVTARVTFDGTDCSYTGPTVLPYPSSLTVDFAPTDESYWVGIIAIKSGTTQAQIHDPANPDPGTGATPDWAYLDTHMFTGGSGAVEYRAVTSGENPMASVGPDGKPYDTFLVLCLTSIPGHPAENQTILYLAPAASVTPVTARVTFDGTTCNYTGPTVLPYPSNLMVDFAPTDESYWLGIMAVKSGTTQTQLEDPALPDVGVGTPDFVYLDTHMFTGGSGTVEYRAVDTGANPMASLGPDGKPYDTFVVMCLTAIPGRPTGGMTLLRVQ